MIDLDFWKNKVIELQDECENKQNEIEELESECEKIHKQLMKTEKDAQAHILELKTEIERLSAKENLCEHKDLLAQLQDRHQQDCIEINRLNTVIEVLIDKYSSLRQQMGL